MAFSSSNRWKAAACIAASAFIVYSTTVYDVTVVRLFHSPVGKVLFHRRVHRLLGVLIQSMIFMVLVYAWLSVEWGC